MWRDVLRLNEARLPDPIEKEHDMIPDLNALPVSGGFVLALLLWALISVYGLGPEIAEREIHRTEWHNSCPAALRAKIEAKRPANITAPSMSCHDFGRLADEHIGYGTGNQLCNGVGSMFGDMIELASKFDPNRIAMEQAKARTNSQLSQAAELAPTRCSCAASSVASDKVRWGIHAGTGRLAGNGADTLIGDLTQALHTPACALKVEE